jgi:hypothetical protein
MQVSDEAFLHRLSEMPKLTALDQYDRRQVRFHHATGLNRGNDEYDVDTAR